MNKEINSVSVIITCYNEGCYVSDAVVSVVSQSWAHRIGEIVIVDDGSAEDTLSVIRRLSIIDNRIRTIFQENAGLPSARNRAILETTGEYIAILDADDVWLPNKLECQLPALDASDTVALSYTDLYLAEPDNLHVRQLVRCRSFQPETPNRLRRFFVEDAPIIPSCTILRRKAVMDVGLFDPNFVVNEDFEMWVRLLAKHPCVHEAKPTLIKRARLNSLGADELRRLPYHDRISVKATNANPELAPLVGKRRARKLLKVGNYLENGARSKEARLYYLKAAREDTFFLRAYLFFLLSFAPRRLNLTAKHVLRRLKHR